MESTEDIRQGRLEACQVKSIANERRVLTQLRKFTDPATSTPMLLAADSCYGANTFDGKFKVFTIADLVKSGKTLDSQYYVETPYGV